MPHEHDQIIDKRTNVIIPSNKLKNNEKKSQIFSLCQIIYRCHMLLQPNSKIFFSIHFMHVLFKILSNNRMLLNARFSMVRYQSLGKKDRKIRCKSHFRSNIAKNPHRSISNLQRQYILFVFKRGSLSPERRLWGRHENHV